MATLPAPHAAVSAPVTSSERPPQVSWAVFLRVATVILNFLTPLLPGADVPMVGIVVTALISVIMLVAAKGLWDLRRWGAILMVVLTTLSILTAIPAVLEDMGNWMVAAIVILTVFDLVILALVVHPAARRAYRRG